MRCHDQSCSRERLNISTHALYAWVRQARVRVETRDVSFQFTPPARGATRPPGPFAGGKFQLPHPARGATRRNIRQNWACLISTPAPREGCDISSFFNAYRLFQLTHPMRGRPYSVPAAPLPNKFQFPHTVLGATPDDACLF